MPFIVFESSMLLINDDMDGCGSPETLKPISVVFIALFLNVLFGDVVMEMPPLFIIVFEEIMLSSLPSIVMLPLLMMVFSVSSLKSMMLFSVILF